MACGAWRPAAEFQKIRSYPGVVGNELIGVLARLGLGRAYALEAGIDVAPGFNPAHAAQTGRAQGVLSRQDALAKARTAYQDFFALWKDADPDIPVLRQAQREYVDLR